ncbi:hypothetical protein HNR19_000282 [Nocardioides thalensis]|uniref:Uncharacterized protein n=1 Tax=Nocardioides thalensis TaxID=1914755 RepID=A0A853BWY5_9ACTN|nr:hypothetical protein [Nocardioides thalensis]NYI99583.1 hypothetical protein [Nocardioides thalensis]
MSTYAIDSDRQTMVATGIVSPVFEWIETPDGKRRPGEIQARDEDTGMPLWNVEVSFRVSMFGRESTVNANVGVGAVEKPEPAMYSPIVFDGLVVSVRLNKNGGFTEYWSADGVKDYKREPVRARGVGTEKPGESKAVA